MSLKPRQLRSTARKAQRAAARTKRSTRRALAKVPGPSSNPATNLLIIDVAVRGLSLLAGRSMEKALLRTRYQQDKAADIIKGRPLIQSMAATGAARMATRSVPGFLAVTGGLLVKAVFDRSIGRREAMRRGEQQFADQAAKADE
jgi:hypothetical protein